MKVEPITLLNPSIIQDQEEEEKVPPELNINENDGDAFFTQIRRPSVVITEEEQGPQTSSLLIKHDATGLK